MNTIEQLFLERKKKGERLRKEAPNLFTGFTELMKQYYKKSALEIKYKELIAVGLSVATRCSPCLVYHANQACSYGATKEEVLDAAAIGVEFGGGPSFVMVRNELIELLDQLKEKAKNISKND